jgi:signal transduction histidine kinase
MDAAHISAMSALAGSAIGGFASIATTWLTQHAQDRAQRQTEAIAHRQRLYEEFIDEAAKSFADALTHDLEEPARIVRLYALVGKLRLFAAKGVISKADEVMRNIVETYYGPNRDFRNREDRQTDDIDVVRAFAEVCREDLRA